MLELQRIMMCTSVDTRICLKVDAIQLPILICLYTIFGQRSNTYHFLVAEN